MVAAVAGVAAAAGRTVGKSGLVDFGEDPHLAGERHEVVPLVSELPPGRQTGGGDVAATDRLDDTRLVAPVVVVVGATEQTLVPLPVVLSAEREGLVATRIDYSSSSQ